MTKLELMSRYLGAERDELKKANVILNQSRDTVKSHEAWVKRLEETIKLLEREVNEPNERFTVST